MERRCALLRRASGSVRFNKLYSQNHDNVRGHFAAFVAFKAKNQCLIIILLFETLKFLFYWNFCGINWFWATAPMDFKNHDGTKKIAKKWIFRLNFEVLAINSSLWNFTWSLQLSWISICEFIKILYVHCMDIKKELTVMWWRPKMSTARTWKLSLPLFNGGQRWPFFSFFYLLENWLEYIFFSCPPEKFYDIWAQLTKMSSKSENLLLHEIFWHFCQIGKWTFSQLH